MDEPQNQAAPATELRQGEQGQRGGFWWLMWLLAAMAIYVLSVGPVMKLRDMGAIPPGSTQVIYAPLIFADGRLPWGHAFFVWYISGVWNAR